jgi:hypothetical protein
MVQRGNSEWVIAIRFAGEIRELIGLKTTANGDIYAFPPLARVPVPPVNVHMSKHRSGERHLSVRLKGKRHPTPETKAKLQPTSNFSGVELLSHNPLFKGQFPNLPPLGTNRGKIVQLDADLAGFRDDFLAVRVYLVEPNKEHEIPAPMDVAPHILHIEKSVSTWVAVEVFQEKPPG